MEAGTEDAETCLRLSLMTTTPIRQHATRSLEQGGSVVGGLWGWGGREGVVGRTVTGVGGGGGARAFSDPDYRTRQVCNHTEISDPDGRTG